MCIRDREEADYDFFQQEVDNVPDESSKEHAEKDSHKANLQKVQRWLRGMWKDRYGTAPSPTLVADLSCLLFMKRKSRKDSGVDADYASQEQEETGWAILDVLHMRHEFLEREGITDMSHVLTEPRSSKKNASSTSFQTNR